MKVKLRGGPLDGDELLVVADTGSIGPPQRLDYLSLHENMPVWVSYEATEVLPATLPRSTKGPQALVYEFSGRRPAVNNHPAQPQGYGFQPWTEYVK